MNRFYILISIFFAACGAKDVFVEPKLEAESSLVLIEQVADKEYVQSDVVIGNALFYDANGVITLTIELNQMTPNSSKAVHIHEGTVEQPGRHWNQGLFSAFCNVRSLGQLWAKPYAGDVGNVEINGDGEGQFTISTDFWAIGSGDQKDILNAVVIVHDMPEDFLYECDQNHSHDMPHMNKKIAGGTINPVGEIQ